MQRRGFTEKRRKQRKQLAAQVAVMAVMVFAVVFLAAWQINNKAQAAMKVEEPEEPVSVVLVVESELPQIEVLYDVPLEEDVQRAVIDICEGYEIDPTIVFGMIQQESCFQSDVVGDNGRSFGLMQVQERFHTARMEKLGVTDLLDPVQNVTVGVDCFAELLEDYSGNVHMALTAYNMGRTGAYAKCFSNGLYTSAYSESVMAKAGEINVLY